MNLATKLSTLTGLNIRVDNFQTIATPKSYWSIKTDGSLGNYTRGAEICSPGIDPLRGAAGLQQLERLCNKLKELRVKVNAKCGFHLHVGDVRNESIDFFRNLLRLCGNNEVHINSVLPESRHHSHW
jgi:hypothetical protein